MLGTAIFAITGVLVVTRRGLDINYAWASLFGALGAFFLGALLRSTSYLLL